jgi:hypothetical protein
MTENQLHAINALFSAASTYDNLYSGETITSDEEWDELEERYQERKDMILASFHILWDAEKQQFVWPT